MTAVQLAIYVILVSILISITGGFMEVYKKAIRKGKAKAWENYIIATFCTLACIVFLVETGMFQPILGLIGGPLWLDYITYFGIIYICQFQADKLLIKRILKALMKNMLNKAGFSDEQITEILNPPKK